MPFARSRRRDPSSDDDSRDDSEDRGRPRTRHFKPSVPMNPPEEIPPITWDGGHVAGLNPGCGKGDKAPAAKRKSAAPKSVSTSRRTKTEKFTASTVGQIGTNHLANWLVACDSTWLGPAVVKGEGVTRELIISALAFNIGLKPGPSLLENDPEEAKSAAAGEYRRRGKPTEHTHWSLETIHKCMSWKMANAQSGSFAEMDGGRGPSAASTSCSRLVEGPFGSTTLNPFLRQIGISQFLPTETDWWAALKSPQGQQAVQSWADRWFDINSEALPDLPKRPSVEPVPDEEPQGPLTGNAILSKMNFKPAGADAMRRSAAAAAYLQSDYKTGFEHVGTCWTGVLLLEFEVYFHRPSKKYLISLGFKAWGVPVILLSEIKIGDTVLLQLDSKAKPMWVFNHTIDEETNVFEFVPTRFLLRRELPMHPQLSGSAILVTGPHEGLLVPAFRRGLSITLPQVRLIYDTLKIPPMKHGEGTGAKGNVLKRDLVRKILEKLFGDSVSKEELERMLNFTAPQNTRLDQKKEPQSPEEQMAQSLNYLVSCLDEDNNQEFKEIVKNAKQSLIEAAREAGKNLVEKELKATLAEQLKRAEEKVKELEAAAAGLRPGVHVGGSAAGDASAAASGSRVGEVHRRVTPKEFKSLFPFVGSAPGLSMKHDQSEQIVQVVFPSKDDLVQSCRREWPTGTCPDALSAIKIVTEFAFSRYNRGRVPSDQMRAPTDSEIQSYLDSLKES